GQRIDRLAVFDDLEMEMRAGGPPGIADEADHLSLMNLHTGADAGGKLGKVAVDRRDIVGVLDANPVSIARVRRCAHDLSVGTRMDRRPRWRDQIDPVMHRERGAAPAGSLAGARR